MNPHESFDRELRDLFREYQPEVPADAWSRLQDAQKKRRPNGWWNPARIGLFFTAVSITGICVWYFVFSNKPSVFASSEPEVNQSATSAPLPDPSENSTGQSASATAAKNSNTNTVSGADGVDPASLSGSSTSNTISDNKKSAASTDTDPASLGSNHKSTGSHAASSGPGTFRNYSAASSNKAGIANRNQVPAEMDANQLNQPIGIADLKAAKSGMNFATNRRQHRKKGSGRFRTQSANPIQADSDNSDPADLMTQSGSSGSPDQNLQHLLAEANKIYAASLARPSGTSISPGGIPGCPKSDLDAAGNKDYLEFYAGPDFARKQYSDTGQSVYMQRRKESTQTLLSFSAGVRYTRVFNNGVSFRTGLNYSQINERFRYVNSNTVQMNYEIDPYSGDTLAVTRVTGTRYKTTYNRFRSIDIPLLLGYEMGTGRFHVNLNAGLLVNIYNWQKGDVLDTSFHPVSITTGKGNAQYMYKTNAGLGFTGGASIYYRLNDRYHLLAEPYFRYHFAPISNSALSLQEKFTTLGIRLGLRMDF